MKKMCALDIIAVAKRAPTKSDTKLNSLQLHYEKSILKYRYITEC